VTVYKHGKQRDVEIMSDKFQLLDIYSTPKVTPKARRILLSLHMGSSSITCSSWSDATARSEVTGP